MHIWILLVVEKFASALFSKRTSALFSNQRQSPVCIHLCLLYSHKTPWDWYLFVGGDCWILSPEKGECTQFAKKFRYAIKGDNQIHWHIYIIYIQIYIYIHFKLFLDKNDSTHKSAESNRNLNHEDPKDDPSSPSVSIVSAKALLVQAFNKSSTVLGGVKPMSFKAPSRGIFCDHSFSTPMCASAVITMASDKYTMAVARAVARLRFNCNNIWVHRSNLQNFTDNSPARVLHRYYRWVRTFLNLAACMPAMNARCIKSFSRPVIIFLPSTRLLVAIA